MTDPTSTPPPAVPPATDQNPTVAQSNSDVTPVTVSAKLTAVAVTVPNYEVFEEIGRGGMGIVYRARDTRLDRIVALKMILAGAHADPDQRARFLQEARAAAQLQHPNIVQVFEVGEHDGCPYFSMEYVPGGSLADLVAAGPLP